MREIFKHLKKFTGLLVAFVLIVALQAVLNLSLPQYTTDIVNVGIEQAGIESAVPSKLSASEFAKVLALAGEQERTEFASLYEEQEGIYYLQGKSAEQLSGFFELRLGLLYYLDSEGTLTAPLRDMLKEEIPAYGSYEGLPSDFLAEVEPGLLSRFLKRAGEFMTAQGEGVAKQAAIAYLQGEYSRCGIDIDALRNDYILKKGLLMLAMVFMLAICSVGSNFCSSRFGAGFSRSLRSSVFRRVMKFSHKELGVLSTATLITRCTNDIQQIQMMFAMSLRSVIFSPIMGIGSLYMMIKMDAGMAWVAATALIGILVLVFTIITTTMPRFKKLQEQIDRINQVAREALSGLPVVRAFSREEYENARFDKANRALMHTNLFVSRVMSVMGPGMSLIMNGICVLILWVGSGLVNAGSSQVGDLLAYIQYAMHIVLSFMFLSMVSVQLPRAIISIRRVGEILDMPISIDEPDSPLSLPKDSRGEIEFRHVSFRYPNAEQDVLHDISFIAKPGQTTAFIGSTGSGKSTLINLIPRFFDVSEGEILLDDIDIRQLSLHDLRAAIGYVPQKGQLFTGTIASNIAYGDAEISEQRMKEAANIAQAADFIDEAPEGYQREIAQGGTNVSGGQRQRLSIARAIAKNPAIYIFDDSFSALDFKTDAALRKALATSTSKACVLIVAQRISTVLRAEQIVVLDEGRVVGIGRHEELLRSCAIYRQIAESQLNEEELQA